MTSDTAARESTEWYRPYEVLDLPVVDCGRFLDIEKAATVDNREIQNFIRAIPLGTFSRRGVACHSLPCPAASTEAANSPAARRGYWSTSASLRRLVFWRTTSS